jgi:hypothetical protein
MLMLGYQDWVIVPISTFWYCRLNPFYK